MYLVDYHVHTKRCGHAGGEDREYVEAAIQKGLKEIGFSDHVPRFYQPPHEGIKVTERGMPEADLEHYVETVTKFKQEYTEISVKLGLEVDYIPGWEDSIADIAAQYPWDYLMGSVHFIPEWDFGYIRRNQERSSVEVFTQYFIKVAEAAESTLFDLIGHIDLPSRFFERLSEPEMKDRFEDLAIRLGKAGAVIELNSYGIRGSEFRKGEVLPEPSLLRLCRQHGINVTTGSDAHKPEEVGAHFQQVRELLTTIGYDRIIVFQRRQKAAVYWNE